MGRRMPAFGIHSNVCGRKESVRVRRQQATLAAHDNSNWAALLLYLPLVRLAPYVFSSRLFAYNGNVCV
jgi:hypothetical protein